MSFLRDSESTLKGKIRSRWNFLKICLSQQLFSFKNFCIKCHKVDHDDYRKVLQFTLLLLNTKKICVLFRHHWIFRYFWRSNWHNLRNMFWNVSKLYFSKRLHKSLKTCQGSRSNDHCGCFFKKKSIKYFFFRRISKVLTDFCYFTTVFDLETFDCEMTALWNVFKIYTKTCLNCLFTLNRTNTNLFLYQFKLKICKLFQFCWRFF